MHRGQLPPSGPAGAIDAGFHFWVFFLVRGLRLAVEPIESGIVDVLADLLDARQDSFSIRRNQARPENLHELVCKKKTTVMTIRTITMTAMAIWTKREQQCHNYVGHGCILVLAASVPHIFVVTDLGATGESVVGTAA